MFLFLFCSFLPGFQWPIGSFSGSLFFSSFLLWRLLFHIQKHLHWLKLSVSSYFVLHIISKHFWLYPRITYLALFYFFPRNKQDHQELNRQNVFFLKIHLFEKFLKVCPMLPIFNTFWNIFLQFHLCSTNISSSVLPLRPKFNFLYSFIKFFFVHYPNKVWKQNWYLFFETIFWHSPVLMRQRPVYIWYQFKLLKDH